MNPESSSAKQKSWFQPSNNEAMELLSPAVINFMKKSSSSTRLHLILNNFQKFKKFDLVEEIFDHHFVSEHCSTSKKWVKLIEEERENLKKNLPDSIFVRAYVSRLDLLTGVMVGAEGTPYHNGLFFFDVHFPTNYPTVAPLVYFYANDYERLNPFLEIKSRIPLDRIKVWPNSNQECWIPGVSTVLDVLVSIQQLVFNERPFFNHFFDDVPSNGIPIFKIVSQIYNENVFTVSLMMMSSTMRNPPKYFEDLVVGHFVTRAQEILAACITFLEDGGASDVGDVLKRTGVSNIVPTAESVSLVRIFVNRLVLEFSKIGVRDCEKFLTAEIIKAGQNIYEYHEKTNFSMV